MFTTLAQMIQAVAKSGNTALLSARMFDTATTKSDAQREIYLKNAVDMFQTGSTVEQVAQMLETKL